METGMGTRLEGRWRKDDPAMEREMLGYGQPPRQVRVQLFQGLQRWERYQSACGISEELMTDGLLNGNSSKERGEGRERYIAYRPRTALWTGKSRRNRSG